MPIAHPGVFVVVSPLLRIRLGYHAASFRDSRPLQHVFVDATPFGSTMSGAKRRAVELLHRLPAHLKQVTFHVHWSQDPGGESQQITADNVRHYLEPLAPESGWRGWRYVQRLIDAKRRSLSIRAALTDHGPVLTRPPTIVTVHDLRHRHGYARMHRRLYGRLAYGCVLRRARAIVTVSDAIKQEVVEAYGVPASKVHTIYNAPSLAAWDQPDVRRAGLLLVGRDEPRKRCSAAAWVAEHARMPLCHIAGDRPDAAVRKAYASSRWLLAPSAYEGSHLPVMEALAMGLAVIASDIPAHRELVDRGARGLILVPSPRGTTTPTWTEALAALTDTPPMDVSPPPWTWDDAAKALANLLRTIA